MPPALGSLTSPPSSDTTLVHSDRCIKDQEDTQVNHVT